MTQASFIGYVGPSDFHDGSVLAVYLQDSIVRVRIDGASGKQYVVKFSGVNAVRSNNPVGMFLYAVSEMRIEPPLRRFVFANWNDDDTAFLEVDAESFAVADADIENSAL